MAFASGRMLCSDPCDFSQTSNAILSGTQAAALAMYCLAHTSFHVSWAYSIGVMGFNTVQNSSEVLALCVCIIFLIAVHML